MDILLADSDPLFGRIVQSRLEKLGHTVSLVADGAEAWSLYEHSRFRFVITEFDLPGLNGAQLCRNIRSAGRRRHTYVLFYAGRSDSDSIVDAYQAGADDYLSKPFNPVLLDLRIAHGMENLNREDDLRVVANHDDSTGFIKYDTFMRFFSVYESGARRYGYKGVVTFVSIDNYDELCDRHGHAIAGQTKSMVAALLGSSIRSSDLIAHVGEDTGEFCILMPDTAVEGVKIVVDRIDSKIKSTAIHSGKDVFRPQLSFATANYPHENLSAEQSLAPENRVSHKLSPAA